MGSRVLKGIPAVRLPLACRPLLCLRISCDPQRESVGAKRCDVSADRHLPGR
jgi:hypothetical protein